MSYQRWMSEDKEKKTEKGAGPLRYTSSGKKSLKGTKVLQVKGKLLKARRKESFYLGVTEKPAEQGSLKRA